MKIILKTIVLIIIISISSHSQDHLKVITYNIQGMKPNTNHEIRLENIIEKLKVLDPDIIGIQEINQPVSGDSSTNQAKIIVDSLSNYFGITYNYFYSQTHLAWDNRFREFVGIITKHPVIEQGFKQLPAGVFPRKVVWNYIDSPLGKINMFNAHLSFNSASVRVNQVNSILPYIEETEANNDGIASILTGDFNDNPGAQSILLITDSGNDTTFFDTYKFVNPDEPGNTMPSNSPNTRIDYIFYRNSGALAIDTSLIIMNEPFSGNQYCSDHLGVMTFFTNNVTDINDFENKEIPADFRIYQNYPNPFNPSTKIKFVIFKTGFYSLKIFNSLGELKRIIFEKNCSPGDYEITFDAGDLTSGIYFYMLTGNRFSEIKKMIYLK